VLIDRTHRTWFFVSVIIMAVASVGYVVYANSTPKGPSGGSLVGLLYGVIGTAMMLFAGLLAARKKVSFWRLGSAKFWLRGHLWLGTLSFPIIMFHAGFEWGGRLEQVLWIFFGVVMLSGFFGLLMQNILPRLLHSRIPLETMKAQIPYIRKRNRIISDRMVSTSCGPIPLENDPMAAQLTKLAKHASKVIEMEKSAKGKPEKDKAKEAKSKWTEQVATDDVGLYLDLAGVAKGEWGARTENDFTAKLLDIYTIKGLNDKKPEPAAAADTKKKAGGSPLDQTKGKPASPLDKMKAKGKPAGGDKPASPLDQMKAKKAAPAGGDKPLSPLEQMKAKKAAPAGGDKPLSPLEQMKAKKAAPAGGDKPLSPLEQMKAKKATPDGGDKPLSPLEQMKAKKAAAEGGDKPLSPLEQMKAKKAAAEGGDKPLSPLEQMKAKKAAAEGGEKPLSPLEQMKAKKAAAEGGDKPLSPLEQMKAKKAAAEGGDKPLSPLEQMKAKKAAADKGGDSETAEVDTSKLSPLEQARLAGPLGGPKKVALSGGAPTAPAPVKKVAGPKTKGIKKPAPTPAEVSDIDSELAAIQKLFIEKYNYNAAEAKKFAESTRTFLKTDPAALKAKAESEVKSIAALFSEKYGFSGELANEIAELTRPFVDGTAEEEAAAKKTAAAEAAAAAKKPKASAKPAAGKKALSPLDAARAAGAAGAAKGKPKAAAGASPLDQMKAKAGAAKAAPAKKKAAKKKAAVKKPSLPKKKAAKKKSPVLRTEELRKFYLDQVRPYLVSDGKSGRLADKTEANRAFTAMRATLPVDLHDTLGSLREHCDEHRQFAEQQRIHNWLHYWLALHIPFSIALYVLAAVHIVVALRVIPWELPQLW
jgi:hypothetical protein